MIQQLYRLRQFFLLYFLVLIAIDYTLGKTFLDINSFNSILPSGVLMVLVSLVYAVMFGIGVWLFHFLMMKRNWARIVLLILAWLNIIDAVSGLIFAPVLARFVEFGGFGLDWDRLLLVDRVKDFAGFVFWGYVLYLLQFNARVKQEFLSTPGSEPV